MNPLMRTDLPALSKWNDVGGKAMITQTSCYRVMVRLRHCELGNDFPRGLFALLILAVIGLLGGCGEGGGFLDRFVTKQDEIIVERRPDPAYDQLFPYYVELCTTSQFRPKEGNLGGVAGHAVMYIKGACKDEDAPFPKLRRCRAAATSAGDPEHGAGVSVNRWLRNVNWLAFPGNALFFKGNLKSGEPLTQAHFDATVRDAIEKGVYDGVEFHDFPAGGDLESFVTNHSIGTDFALQFARSVFCARVPGDRAGFGRGYCFSERQERRVRHGRGRLQLECASPTTASIPSATLWPPPISGRRYRCGRSSSARLFNLAVPANEFVNLARLGAEGPLENYREIQNDDLSLQRRVARIWLASYASRRALENPASS